MFVFDNCVQLASETLGKSKDASCHTWKDERAELRERTLQQLRKEEDCQARQKSLVKEQKRFANAQEEFLAKEGKFVTLKKFLQVENGKLVNEIRHLSHILDQHLPVMVPPSNPPVKAIPPAPPTPPAPNVEAAVEEQGDHPKEPEEQPSLGETTEVTPTTEVTHTTEQPMTEAEMPTCSIPLDATWGPPPMQ